MHWWGPVLFNFFFKIQTIFCKIHETVVVSKPPMPPTQCCWSVCEKIGPTLNWGKGGGKGKLNLRLSQDILQKIVLKTWNLDFIWWDEKSWLWQFYKLISVLYILGLCPAWGGKKLSNARARGYIINYFICSQLFYNTLIGSFWVKTLRAIFHYVSASLRFGDKSNRKSFSFLTD